MLVSRQVHDRKGCIIAQQFSTHRKSHSSSFILLFLLCFWAVVWLFVHRETCEMVHHFELLCDNAIFHSSLGDFTGATQDANSHRFVVYREERGPVLVSSPALHGWEEAQSSRQRDLYDQGGKMAARDVQKEVLRPGNGPCPSKGSTITVHCTGSLNTNPPKKFWRYWFCYECISIARLISRACMSCMWKYFFLFLALLPIRNNVTIRIVLGNIRSRENKTNWFPEGLDVKCFVIFLDFHFNSNKGITRANQNSRLGTYNNTNLIPKTTEWMIYEVLSLYCLHLFALLAAISLLGWL